MRKVDSSGLHFDRAFDFALAFWMLHEVPDEVMVLAENVGFTKSSDRSVSLSGAVSLLK